MGTPRQRHQAEQTPFQISIGRETTPGAPAAVMQPVLASDSDIAWTATLLPFADELPAGADWIQFGRFTKPGPSVERAAHMAGTRKVRARYIGGGLAARAI